MNKIRQLLRLEDDVKNEFRLSSSQLGLLVQAIGLAGDPPEVVPSIQAPSLGGALSKVVGGHHSKEQLQSIVDRIPQREVDLLYLYFVQKKRQADIAEAFGVTQAAVSYRLDRGLQRVKFLLSIPVVTEGSLRETLAGVFEQDDIEILVGIWQTTCQSEVAANLGMTQGRVRHRLFKAVRKLKRLARGSSLKSLKFKPLSALFLALTGDEDHATAKSRFNILREIKLPQWQDRHDALKVERLFRTEKQKGPSPP